MSQLGAGHSAPLVRPFRIGGPAAASWREHALARAAEYRFLARRLFDRGGEREDLKALDAIERHIDAAERAAAGEGVERRTQEVGSDGDPSPTLTRWAKLMLFLSGAPVERVSSQLDAAQTEMLRLAPDQYVCGQLTNLVAHVQLHLQPNDPRRQRVERIAENVACRKPDQRSSEIGREEHVVSPKPHQKLSEIEREEVVGAVRAASLDARREVRRVRSFRNILFVSALILAIGVVGVIIFGALSPGRIALCFVPDNEMVVCPTASKAVPQEAQPERGEDTPSAQQQVDIDRLVRNTASPWDIAVVALVGLLAAGLAGAFTLRQIQGTSTPYSLPIAAAVLKLPTGALTAVVGLLLMRGGFVPGLSALDTSAQIAAWAIVFGYAQQLFTRFVDQQADTVLRTVDNPTTPQLEPPRDSELRPVTA
jgi:hypothetical protein